MTVRYSTGKDNPADYLSRHPDPAGNPGRSSERAEEYVNFVKINSTPLALTQAEIQHATKNDSDLQTVINHHRTNTMYSIKDTHRCYWNIRDEISVTDDGIVLKQDNIIIPESLTDRVVELAHRGHQGITKTKALLRTKVWFPNIAEKVEQKVKECIPCQATTPREIGRASCRERV
jgi:hypothetical protein